MGRSALAGVGSCLQKGPALSDIHQFVRIAQIKRLNSNCVLVLMFQVPLAPRNMRDDLRNKPEQFLVNLILMSVQFLKSHDR